MFLSNYETVYEPRMSYSYGLIRKDIFKVFLVLLLTEKINY